MKDVTARPFATLPFTLRDLRAAYEGGARPEAILAEVSARLTDIDDPGIFIHRRAEDALLAEAAALGPYDPAKPLWGVPFAVKDNIDVAGVPTTAACPAFSYVPEQDAFAVAQLRAAGAIPVGKTNLDQFATGLVGVRSPYPPPRNAIDPAIVPGGSSSGSGVVVRHGALPFALGTDTAGSGRVPAALNGIVGLKPTLGAISREGVVPACRTLDTVSVFAPTIADAHAVYAVAALFDPADPYARPTGPRTLPAALPHPRIAVPDAGSLRFFGDTIQAADFAATCARLREAGGAVSEVDLTPFYDVAAMLYEGAWVAERYAVIDDLVARDPQAVHPVTRDIVAKAQDFTAVDAFRGQYRLAELAHRCRPLLEAVDMLCVPTIPTFYTVRELDADPVTPNARLGTYTNFVNLLDLCALAVPTGPRSDGRPGSVTFIAPAGADGRIAAQALALNLSGAEPAAAPPPAQVQDGEMALAVCGAHMSGLPLNRLLTTRGGRFLRATETAAAYRLYALPGGPPARPGMVRSDGGAAIAVEVWAVPLPRAAEVLAEIPYPLGLGKVALNDGTEVTGFVCDPAGLPGAEDITVFGGWRAYLAASS